MELSEKEMEGIAVLMKYLFSHGTQQTNFTASTEQGRKTIRADIPPGIKNVQLLLQTLTKLHTAGGRGVRMGNGGVECSSDVIEMEFCDSEE